VANRREAREMTRQREITQEILVPAGHARATRVEAGQLLEIINVQGRQVCDFVAFNAENFDEHLSPTHTRSMLGRLTLRVGDLLRTNARNPIFELVEDTVGCHDLLIAACDHRRYELDYGLKNHRNCRANFGEVLGPHGIGYLQVPDPINLFQNTPVAADGTLGMEVSPAESGDKVTLRALGAVLVAASACPQDQNPINGWEPSEIRLVVRGPE
jgi:uncharacterized protein YcgI (DUF1989 family)